MSLHVINVEQGSDEWHDARRGIVTASVVGQLVSARRPSAIDVDCPKCGAASEDPCAGARVAVLATPHSERADVARQSPPVIAPTGGIETKALATLLASERITGWTEEGFTSRAMERGHMDEPLARDHYSETHKPADEAGFMVRDDWGFIIGYSPDGLVDDDGLLEIKSRAPKKHLATIVAGTVPAENMAQLQAGLLVSGRDWIDYVSWCGGMPMYPIRVYPDEAWFAAIVAAAEAVEVAIRDLISTYSDRVAGLPVTERIDYEMEMVI